MLLKILGAAAGGGLPQWNCSCRNCQAVRQGDADVSWLNQSSLAIQAPEGDWFLVNASPDVRQQLELLRDTKLLSISFQSDRPCSLVKFQELLNIHLSENTFRAKGIIWFKETSLRHIFQLSGKRIELQTDQWQQ